MNASSCRLATSALRATLCLIAAYAAAGCEHAKLDNQSCTGDGCVASSTPIAWNKPSATYTAVLMALDATGAPVDGARVQIADRYGMTGADGRARLGGVLADAPQRLRLSKSGLTPRVWQTTPFRSAGRTELTVLMPLGTQAAIDPQKHASVSHDGALVELPAGALARKDGTRPAAATAELTLLPPASLPESALPDTGEAYGQSGARTVMSRPLNILYAHFTGSHDETLNLAAGQAAVLEIPLPKSAPQKTGAKLPLWGLDEASGAWRREASCVVGARQVGKQSQLVCRGAVPHFSFWALATELDIYQPGSLGCLNVTAAVADSKACYTVNVVSEDLLACDGAGEQCSPVAPPDQAFFAGAAGAAVDYCSVLPADPPTYRVRLTYDTSIAGCASSSDAPLPGRRTKLSDPVALSSFKTTLGSDLMINFTLQGERDCPTLCAQAKLQISTTDLTTPTWIDRDDDGYFVTSDGKASSDPGIPVDCNDGDVHVHPGAVEPFCAGADLNCDGQQPKAAQKLTDLDPQQWNDFCAVCKAGTPKADASETPGNAYDENCDGKVAGYDNDKDGVIGGDGPDEDCNDWDTAIKPGLPEVVGNYTDEDCDGAAVDMDGDGMPSPQHIVLAKQLGIPADKFVDCDDLDPSVNPQMKASDEAGQLALYYYRKTGETTLRRRAAYCDLFFEDGTPDFAFHQSVRDLNCDGMISDADGDGFTAPGDHSLGAQQEGDCDDFDPRIVPTRSSDAGAADDAGPADGGTGLTCVTRKDLPNDSSCDVQAQSYLPGTTCPMVSTGASSIKTSCAEALNSVDGGAPSGSGKGVCSFLGWPDGNPPNPNAGRTWGPCDGVAGNPANKLPDCPPDTLCGGTAATSPSPWTGAFESYVTSANKVSGALSFHGLCFPACTVQPKTAATSAPAMSFFPYANTQN